MLAVVRPREQPLRSAVRDHRPHRSGLAPDTARAHAVRGAQEPHALLVARTMGQPLWKTVWLIPIKRKTDLSCGPAITVLGVHPKGLKT